jgi:hypothetical protein
MSIAEPVPDKDGGVVLPDEAGIVSTPDSGHVDGSMPVPDATFDAPPDSPVLTQDAAQDSPSNDGSLNDGSWSDGSVTDAATPKEASVADALPVN